MSSGNRDPRNTNIHKGSVDMTSPRDLLNMVIKPSVASKGLVGKKNRPQTAGRYGKSHHSTAVAGPTAQPGIDSKDLDQESKKLSLK